MSLDLNQSNVSLENQVFDPMLKTLQANILKGHGRDHAHHLFFKLSGGKAADAKAWIIDFAATKITSAKKQLEDTKAFNADHSFNGGPVFTLSISSTGYDALEISLQKPANRSFTDGLKASAEKLADDVSSWDAPFKDTIDLFILVADDDPLVAKNAADAIITATQAFATLLINQKGNVLKQANNIGIEHFGYADGVSQPLYLTNEIQRQASTLEWDDTTELNKLLVPETLDDGQAEVSFGSYLVFRKLEQNVKGFKTAEGDNGSAGRKLPKVHDDANLLNADLPGAFLVGRFEDGTPVVKTSGASTAPNAPTNDFNYSDDLIGLKCPFHAHTRLMNPRKGDQIAGDVSSHRITRRGMPYDDVGRIPVSEISNITEELLDANQPENGVGLLFMCYQNNITNQFEVLQAFWSNLGIIANGFTGQLHDVNGHDGIIAQGAISPTTFPIQWGKSAQTKPFNFGGFVTNKGGEYFFTPSISFLKSL